MNTKSLCPITVDAANGTQRFHPCIAQAMSLWCILWLGVYAINYVQLTWRLISELGGFHWILFCSPSFWGWLGVFSLCACVVERLIRVSWHDFEKGLSLTKVAILILVLPFALWCFLAQTCPFLFPAVSGTLRLVPILGGRGF